MAIVESINDQGFALARGALPLDLVARYREALDAVYERSESNGDVLPQDFTAASGLQMAGLFAPLLGTAKQLLGAYHDGQSVFMSVAVAQKNAMQGIPFHTDGIIQGTSNLVLSMWAPFHECGANAPGLAVVPASRRKVLAYLRRKFPGKRIPGWHSAEEWSSRGAFEAGALRAEFGEPYIPVLNPGDVMLFTNWTIHGSHITAKMNERRSAAIYRLERKAWRERFRDHEFQLFGRRYNLKAWIDRHVP